jgi:hypothetical protein
MARNAEIGILHSLYNQAPKKQFSTKIHFMDNCTCLKHTNGLIFSSLVVKRSFIGVSMKSSLYGRIHVCKNKVRGQPARGQSVCGY